MGGILLLFERRKALMRKDFEKIRVEDASLYDAITGSAYMRTGETCFRILKTLKTGKIYEISLASGFTTQMVYENNDWIFDPSTRRQYKRDDFTKKFHCPWGYGNWEYEDVQNITYSEFWEKYGRRIRLQDWANHGRHCWAMLG